jgi:hypothetical protein
VSKIKKKRDIFKFIFVTKIIPVFISNDKILWIQKYFFQAEVWWHMPLNPSTREMEAGGSRVRSQPGPE